MNVNFSAITFTGYHKPKNYQRIDETVVRSAQPKAEEIVWMKNHRGITDIVNFRRSNFDVAFDEKMLTESLGIYYHSIPTRPRDPDIINVKKFLSLVEEIKEKNGRILMHCQAGVDRTGFNALIYKVMTGLSNFDEAAREMLAMGHHHKTYPNLIPKAAEFLKQLKK